MRNYLSLVKFSHTIFALPFALIGFFIGDYTTPGPFDYKAFFLVLLCMVFARNAAMAFNRYLDRDIDKANPRTAKREIPAGIISPQNALLFVTLNSLLFVATTWFINTICFFLSPVALLVVLGYSYTKRFTPLCHFVLGLGLSFAPIGAYLAATGVFDVVPVLYGAAVLTWVAGFDLIYALQDEQFDKSMNLRSIPETLGTKNALRLSEFLHLLTAGFIVLASCLLSAEFAAFNWLLWLGTGIFLASLLYQHVLVRPHDLSRINLAFFTTNGLASLTLGLFTVLDIFV